jgi:hypothetical protein
MLCNAFLIYMYPQNFEYKQIWNSYCSTCLFGLMSPVMTFWSHGRCEEVSFWDFSTHGVGFFRCSGRVKIDMLACWGDMQLSMGYNPSWQEQTVLHIPKFGRQLLFLFSWITRLFSSIHSTLYIVILSFLI